MLVKSYERFGCFLNIEYVVLTSFLIELFEDLLYNLSHAL